jgi:predicted metalloprotease with PDZ domain
MLPLLSAQAEAPAHTIELSVDMRDIDRGIYAVHERIAGSHGMLTLHYPQWIQGNHRASGPIESLAGLEVRDGDKRLAWQRDPFDIYAFRVEVPEGSDAIDVRFQFLSTPWASASSQIGPGVHSTPVMGRIQWKDLVLYPASVPAVEIQVSPSIVIPEGWKFASALTQVSQERGYVKFAMTDLDTLIDSPVYAGRYFRSLRLSDAQSAPVTLNLFGDDDQAIAIPPEELERDKRMVQEAHRLFGTPPYQHYDFMVPLSDTLPPEGLEHLQTSEDGWRARYFHDRDYSLLSRDRLTHEFTHAWNGKYRRPSGLTANNFNVALDDSMLWMYEGGTAYWGYVLASRSGMWSAQETRDIWAMRAAEYQVTAGRAWRSLQDTNYEPLVATNKTPDWPTWRRERDYYYNMMLVWLGADIKIRELSGDQRSLDDFARDFLRAPGGKTQVNPYDFSDICAALNRVAPYDWASFLRSRLDLLSSDTPLLDELSRSGYRLVFRDTPSAMEAALLTSRKSLDLSYSLGITVSPDGHVSGVVWGSPAFESHLVDGVKIQSIDGKPFSTLALRDAVTAHHADIQPLLLELQYGKEVRSIRIDYHGGLRYAHLEREDGVPDRFDSIFGVRK